VYVEEEAMLKIVAREFAKVNFIKSMRGKKNHHPHMHDSCSHLAKKTLVILFKTLEAV
jgi:hypothetical protein